MRWNWWKVRALRRAYVAADRCRNSKLAALEKDMRENPYQRRGARGQQPAQVEIEVGGVTVRQGAKAEKTDRKIPAAQKGRGRMVDEGVEEDQITVQVSRGGGTR
jgi:hypothetical protein